MGEMTSAQNLSRALILVALVIVAGTLGFAAIERWTIWHAFYFTLVTITTVGYGDEGISETGKVFAALLLIGGVTSASYTFAMVIQNSVATQFAWRKRMKKTINGLRHHTIVCGYGRLGVSVCERLAARKSTFVVIERDPDRFALAIKNGYLAIEGVASENGTLGTAGLEHADHVVVTVASFAENIVIAMEVRETRPKIPLIGRAEREEDAGKLERAGVDRVLCPFQSGGRETADYITRPRVGDFLTQAAMAHGQVVLSEIRVLEGSELIGLSLGEFGQTRGHKISLVALERGSGPAQIPPRGDTRFELGDHLIVAGDPEQIAMMSALSKGSRSVA